MEKNFIEKSCFEASANALFYLHRKQRLVKLQISYISYLELHELIQRFIRGSRTGSFDGKTCMSGLVGSSVCFLKNDLCVPAGCNIEGPCIRFSVIFRVQINLISQGSLVTQLKDPVTLICKASTTCCTTRFQDKLNFKNVKKLVLRF